MYIRKKAKQNGNVFLGMQMSCEVGDVLDIWEHMGAWRTYFSTPIKVYNYANFGVAVFAGYPVAGIFWLQLWPLVFVGGALIFFFRWENFKFIFVRKF